MSVRKEVYVVFGLKLDEQTTEDYWEKISDMKQNGIRINQKINLFLSQME
jgi:hypothetical protein